MPLLEIGHRVKILVKKPLFELLGVLHLLKSCIVFRQFNLTLLSATRSNCCGITHAICPAANANR